MRKILNLLYRIFLAAIFGLYVLAVGCVAVLIVYLVIEWLIRFFTF